MRHIAETTVAVSGDWHLRYDRGFYIVSYYGNWKGNFDTSEDALQAIPAYRREDIRKQLEKVRQPEQMTLF
jgi:hypothetical protein